MLSTLNDASAIDHDARQELARSADANLPLVCYWALAGLMASAALFLADPVPAAVLQLLG